MAKRSYRNASDILYDYIVWGQWWDWLLEDLLADRRPDSITKVASAIEQRFPSDEKLTETLAWFARDCELCAILADKSERIRNHLPATAKKPASLLPSPTELAAMNAKQILELVEAKNWALQVSKFIGQVVRPSDLEFLKGNTSIQRPPVAAVALAGLQKLASDDMFDWLREYWQSNPKMSGIHRSPRSAGKVMTCWHSHRN